MDIMDKMPDDAPKVSAFAGGMLRNGITAGSAAAILMTLLVELTKARRERIEMKLEISALPRIREFLKGFTSHRGSDEAPRCGQRGDAAGAPRG